MRAIDEDGYIVGNGERLSPKRRKWFCLTCNRWAYFEELIGKDDEPGLRCTRCGKTSTVRDDARKE